MHPFVDFPLKSIDKTHKICINSNGEMNNYMYYKSKYTHKYHIMEVCNCSNEIIIKVFIYFFHLFRKFSRNGVTHRSIVSQFQ